MEEDGFYVATRVVNPILMKYRGFIIRTYGLKVVDEPLNFLQFSDVAVYAELERMRDDLARGQISRDTFVEKLVELASRYSDLSPEAVQVLSELYEQLTGLSFPRQRQAAAPELVEEPSGATPMRGVCARCAVEGDRSEKPLVRCSYCGDSFCERHAAPRLVMSFNQYQSYLIRYPDIAPLIREHWVSREGHPCTAYTSEFWRNYGRTGEGVRAEQEYEVPVKIASRDAVKTAASAHGSEEPVEAPRTPRLQIALLSGSRSRVVAVAVTFVALAVVLSYVAGLEGFLASLIALAVGVARELAVVVGRVR